MDYGLIEIGNITKKASIADIRKLKSILDRHRIFHIVDGVTVFHPHTKAVRLKENHQGRVGKMDTTGDCLHKCKNHHSDSSAYRQLTVPDLYKLNYMELILFDSEEADFLATVVFGGH